MLTPERIAEIDRRLMCGFVDDAHETIRSLLADRDALLADLADMAGKLDIARCQAAAEAYRAEVAEREAAALIRLWARVRAYGFDQWAWTDAMGFDHVVGSAAAAEAAARLAVGLPTKDAAG